MRGREPCWRGDRSVLKSNDEVRVARSRTFIL
jgi:hypothetical protein